MPGARLTLQLAVLCAVCTSPVYAQSDEHESSEHELSSAHESAYGSHKNVVAFFVGVTHEGRRENGAALGIAYERLLNESFSIGVFAEHTFGGDDFTVYAVPFVYWVDRWKFLVAPGIEDGGHGTESLVRLGAEYVFEVGTLEIAPQLAMDYVGGEKVLVLGVVFGKGF